MHDRTEERTELIRIFTTGDSVQMMAPRRIGKTWLMHKVAEDLQRQGWLTIFVDAEGMQTENEFLRALLQRLEEATATKDRCMNHLNQRLKQLISGDWEGNPLHAIGRVDPKEFAEALVAGLNVQDHDTLILVDEIALFVMECLQTNKDSTKAFLYHLRKLQQAYPKVRWLLTGSIGLDVVARREKLQGAFVNLVTFILEPFDEAAARAYLEDLCNTNAVRKPFALEPDEFVYLAKELGWLAPFYLKLIADQIEPSGGDAENGFKFAQHSDIERAIEQLLEPNRRGAFSTWEEHIDKNFPEDEAKLLHAILNICCEETDGEQEPTLLARLAETDATLKRRQLMDLLTALSNDGVLHETNERWSFRSGLLRRYWLRYQHE